jgi:hypothetical protein
LLYDPSLAGLVTRLPKKGSANEFKNFPFFFRPFTPRLIIKPYGPAYGCKKADRLPIGLSQGSDNATDRQSVSLPDRISATGGKNSKIRLAMHFVNFMIYRTQNCGHLRRAVKN